MSLCVCGVYILKECKHNTQTKTIVPNYSDRILYCKSSKSTLFLHQYQIHLRVGTYTLSEMLSTQGISAPLDQESFKTQAQSYIARVIEKIKSRFPQVHLLTCLGYFDPCIVEKATPIAMLKVGEMLSIDKLWQEFTGYKSLVIPLQKRG